MKINMPVSMKVKEISKILDISKPAISQKISNQQDNLVKTGNKTIGISRELIYKMLNDQGYSHFYRKNIFLFTTVVGGSAKTASCWNLFNAYIRMSSRKNPLIIISTDSQSSIDEIILKNPLPPEKQKVLTDYYSERATIDEILIPINEEENLWLIPSTLNNVFLDKVLSSPKKIKDEGLRLINDIFRKFEGTNPSLFIDTMPALSSSTTTIELAMSQLMSKYSNEELNPVIGIPLRTDQTSLSGAEMAVREFLNATETFGIKDIPKLKVYLANYDKRMSISNEILKALFSNDLLNDYVAETVIRTSTEISKRAYINQSTFHEKLTPITEDYTELLLEFLGYEKKGAKS